VNNFKYYISKIQKRDVYLVFDRYKPYRTKSVTRLGRAVQASRVHQLSDNWFVTRCSAIAERPRCTVRYYSGKKWKTGTGRQYFTDIIGPSSTTVI